MRLLSFVLAVSAVATLCVSASDQGYGPPRESEGTRFLKRVVLAPKHALIGVRRIGGGLIALNGGLLRGTAYFTGVSPLRDKGDALIEIGKKVAGPGPYGPGPKPVYVGPFLYGRRRR